MRTVAIALLIVASGPLLAQPPSAAGLVSIQAMAAAGTEPILAEAPLTAATQHTVAAIVRLSAHTAAIAISAESEPGTYKLVARSKPFTLSQESNFGSWIEDFRFNSPDRIELSFTVRDGCANRSITHRFALRNAVWLVVGLDESVMLCTDNGIEQDWNESTNYLTGKAVRTAFSPSKAAKSSQHRTSRSAFPLSEFPPTGPERAYAEMR